MTEVVGRRLSRLSYEADRLVTAAPASSAWMTALGAVDQTVAAPLLGSARQQFRKLGLTGGIRRATSLLQRGLAARYVCIVCVRSDR